MFIICVIDRHNHKHKIVSIVSITFFAFCNYR